MGAAGRYPRGSRCAQPTAGERELIFTLMAALLVRSIVAVAESRCDVVQKTVSPNKFDDTPLWKVSEDIRACSAALACNTSLHDILCGAN